jgi:hypothetical protein
MPAASMKGKFFHRGQFNERYYLAERIVKKIFSIPFRTRQNFPDGSSDFPRSSDDAAG